MGAQVHLKDDLTAAELRAAAVAAKDANQARRLLALAAVRDGRSRSEAAQAGGMDRQTLRDWVHAYNEGGVAALVNATSPGRPSKLRAEHRAEIKRLVEAGPDVATDGLVRWRRIDLCLKIKDKFGVVVDPDTMGRVLHDIGFSHISARPKHPEQKETAIEDFKKNSARSSMRR